MHLPASGERENFFRGDEMRKVITSLSVFLLVAVFIYADTSFAAPQVKSADIAVADGTTGQDTNTGTGVKTGHIQDGAVTDAKIAGVISRTKIEKYAKVAVVAQSGGDYTSPIAAMSDISSWCGTPSSENPCLLKIMPGIYDISGNQILMQNYVDIEGSGENITKILKTGCCGSTIIGANNSEIRYLSVENSSFDSGPRTAIYLNGTSTGIAHVNSKGNRS